MRPDLEVADIFRRYGPAYRASHDGHLGRVERRVMSAIELCRTAELGGHIEACDDCDHSRVAYNSCRNRHCPKCQTTTRERWLAERQADLLPVPYFHVVFTVPAEAAEIAFQNKAVVYAILFDAVAATLKTAAADPRHLGGEIGFLAILHTWGQTLTHHPHVHCLVPGGALSDGNRWLACRPRFFLPVRVLSRLFRRMLLERLDAAHLAGRLHFSGALAHLNDTTVFAASMRQLRRKDWVVFSKPPFGSPGHVLAYLGRYTHRVAIANSRLVSVDDTAVSFRWRDYRRANAARVMSLSPDEFIRRFLLHTLPDGFHRIRHYGFLANGCRKTRLATIRQLLPLPAGDESTPVCTAGRRPPFEPTVCPCCGGTLRIVSALPALRQGKARPPPDTS